jgi:hypothetical protein
MTTGTVDVPFVIRSMVLESKEYVVAVLDGPEDIMLV